MSVGPCDVGAADDTRSATGLVDVCGAAVAGRCSAASWVGPGDVPVAARDDGDREAEAAAADVGLTVADVVGRAGGVAGVVPDADADGVGLASGVVDGFAARDGVGAA